MPAPKGNKFAAKAPEDLAAERLHIRVTPERKERWQSAADAAGLSLTDWATGALDTAAGFPPEPAITDDEPPDDLPY